MRVGLGAEWLAWLAFWCVFLVAFIWWGVPAIRRLLDRWKP